MAGTSEKIVFNNAEGIELAGRLELPAGSPRAYALFAHCFTCSKDVAAASRISRALCARGFAVLRFDFTGLGNSDGDFANTNFSSNVDDLVAAADALRERWEAPRLLVGHSLGGAAVLAGAARIPEATAVATIAAPHDPGHVRKLLRSDVPEIEASGSAEVQIAGRSFRIRKQFLDDLDRQDVADDIGKLGKALLVLHAPGDTVVGIDSARRIFEAARHPKSFVSLDDADHLLAKKEDGEYVAGLLAAWSARYVEVPEAESPEATPAEDGSVLVVEHGERYGQLVHAGRHLLAADEPASVGGGDTGPTPYGYLLAALGSCTTMTLRMYADRKEWPLEGVAVRARHSRIHARDCAECESETGYVDRIERDIELSGPLDDEQRARLLEIADRCPVHRTMENEKQMITRLAEAETSSGSR